MESFNHKLARIHISSQLLQLCPPRLYRSGVRLFDSFTTLENCSILNSDCRLLGFYVLSLPER